MSTSQKLCVRCKQSKPVGDFNHATRAADGLQPQCRACQSDYYQANAVRHKRRVYERTVKMRALARQHVLTHLETHHCVDCGESDPIVLEFDHVRGDKVANISRMVSGGAELAAIEAEIDKCEVRCANCHRRVTHKRRIAADPRNPSDF